jgi:hypothetical protein
LDEPGNSHHADAYYIFFLLLLLKIHGRDFWIIVGETGVPGTTSKFRIIFQGEYRIYEMNVFHELMSGRK